MKGSYARILKEKFEELKISIGVTDMGDELM